MPEHVTVAVEDLTPGGTVDSDIFSQDMSLLVASGVTLTMGIISSFKRRGITHVQVSANSEMAQLAVPAARPTAPPPAPVAPSATETEQDRFEHLLERTAEVYETHGLEQAIPAEALENATDQMEEFFCEIELGKCAAMNAIYQHEAYNGPPSSKQMYAKHKAIQDLYEEERTERTVLWKDISRLKMQIPETAQEYLGAHRKGSILAQEPGDGP